MDKDSQALGSGARAPQARPNMRKSQRSTRKRTSRRRQWPLWQLVPMVLVVFGILGALLAVLPDYSPIALGIAAVLVLSAVLAVALGAGRSSWWHQIVYGNSFFLLMLGLAIRAWNAVIPAIGLWLTGLVGLYVLAWALPAIEPKLSSLLAREPLAPETRLGRGCLAAALAIGPAAAGLGATLGIYGSRYGQEKLVFLLIGCLGTITVLGWSQVAAHDMWPKRPWAKQQASSDPERS